MKDITARLVLDPLGHRIMARVVTSHHEQIVNALCRAKTRTTS